jgi:hypothetical protein
MSCELLKKIYNFVKKNHYHDQGICLPAKAPSRTTAPMQARRMQLAFWLPMVTTK